MNEIKELTELKNQLTPYNVAKFCIGYTISVGAFLAIMAFLKKPIGPSKGLVKLLTKLGIFVLACKAGDIAQDYFCESADEIKNGINDIKEMMTDVRIK